jgi:hypothetical protein
MCPAGASFGRPPAGATGAQDATRTRQETAMADKGKDGKSVIVKKIEKLAKNDAKHGWGSKSNPNNKPNGK